MNPAVAIHQPNFLPWIGYFSKIRQVDIFVLFDDIQFERGKTYTSRTRILVQGEEKWLTIPVMNRSSLSLIKDIEVNPDFTWKSKHLKTLSGNYRKSPFFTPVYQLIEEAYSINSHLLMDYNIPLILNICRYLGISTRFNRSSELAEKDLHGDKKIMDILIKLKAGEYLSGSGEGSRRYINESEFRDHNILLKWQQFEAKRYPQPGAAEFIKNLSMVDLLFNKGQEAIQYL